MLSRQRGGGSETNLVNAEVNNEQKLFGERCPGCPATPACSGGERTRVRLLGPVKAGIPAFTALLDALATWSTLSPSYTLYSDLVRIRHKAEHTLK